MTLRAERAQKIKHGNGEHRDRSAGPAIQAGSKELRAERELFQVAHAAKQGFNAEAGAKVSTVMGSRIDDQGLVDTVENEIESALHFSDSLPADIENICACLNPDVDVDDQVMTRII